MDTKLSSKVWIVGFLLCFVAGSSLCISILYAKSAKEKESLLQQFKSTTQQLEGKINLKPLEEENRRKEIMKDLYQYIKEELTEVSMKDMVDIAKHALITIPHSDKRSWKERLEFQATEQDEPIIFSSIYWQSDDKELLVIQFDYKSFLLNKRGYLQGTPPHIYFKTGNQLITVDLSEWEYTSLGATTYDIHGFIYGDHGVCPDILISAGPVGSGNFVYFTQMHYGQAAGKWNQVWKTGIGHVVNIEYSEIKSELLITFLPDKFSKNSDQSNYNLKWGGYGK